MRNKYKWQQWWPLIYQISDWFNDCCISWETFALFLFPPPSIIISSCCVLTLCVPSRSMSKFNNQQQYSTNIYKQTWLWFWLSKNVRGYNHHLYTVTSLCMYGLEGLIKIMENTMCLWFDIYLTEYYQSTYGSLRQFFVCVGLLSSVATLSSQLATAY